LQEACDLLNNQLAARDSLAPAVKLLVEAARELNESSWAAEVRRTPDFVVYAVDFELGRLRKNLKAILAAEQFVALKAKQLL
jgi:hypothetical protein